MKLFSCIQIQYVFVIIFYKMNVFEYRLTIPEVYYIYVSVIESNIVVTCNYDNLIFKKENCNDFTWGNCLQNIIIFGMSIMTDLNFNIQENSFKQSLKLILQRIQQFEKLGNVDLSTAVLILFLNEFYSLIQKWCLFIPTLGTSLDMGFKMKSSSMENKRYLIDMTIGLLMTFHILYETVNKIIIHNELGHTVEKES